MVNPRDAIQDAIGVLNDLIQTCRDGQDGFHTAADGVEDPNLKRLFTSYAQQRAEFTEELQREVRQLGGDAERSGHAAGAVHRGWINVKAAVTGKDDGAIISECERGEDIAKRNYQNALEETLPSDVRLLIERQYMQVKDAHDHVRSLEKAHTRK
jgi:uncharacterized protein (TIGR02284 family)